MNRTYRSVWNEALGAWVATSELGGGRRKGGLRVSVATATLLLAVGAAQAQSQGAKFYGPVQITDGTADINPGSMLEVESTNRGVLMPRIALKDRATWGLNGNKPVEGMMVYNTTATTGANGLQAGMAVWKGGQWVSVDETPYLHVNSTATGNSTLANSGATGANSIAIGPGAAANTADSIALGRNASVAAGNSNVQAGGLAIGVGAQVKHNDVKLSDGTVVTPGGNLGSVAIGQNAHANYNKETVVGANAGLNGKRYIPEGETAADIRTYGSDSVMFGTNAGQDSQYLYATFIGDEAGRGSAGQHNSYVGQNAGRWRDGSFNTTLGSNTLAGTSSSSHLTGNNNAAIGTFTGAGSSGDYNTWTGYFAGGYTKGNHNTATGDGAGGGVTGDNNVASGTAAGAAVNGSDNVAIGNFAGYGVSANRTISMGSSAQASADDAIAIGSFSTASGASSISVGTGNTVSGNKSGAFGDPTTITGTGSYSVGNDNKIDANNAFVVGNNVTIDKGLDGAVGIGNNSTVAASTVASYNPGTGKVAGTATGSNVVSVGAEGAERRLTNVAAGGADTDAVNVSQLKATDATANKGWNVSAQGANSTNVTPGASVDLKNSDGNVVVSKTTDSNDVTFNLAKELAANSITTGNSKLDTNGLVVNDGTNNTSYGPTGMTIANGPSVTINGIDAGSKKITNVAPGTISSSSTDAVNGSQLYAVSTAANAGWNISAQGANSTNVAPGASVDLKNSDGNIVVSKTTGSNDVTFNLSKNLMADSITTGNSKLDTNGLTIANGPSVLASGIDAGGKKITNVAAGTAGTDAVNLNQLAAAQAAATTHYYSVNSTGGTNQDNLGAAGADAIASGKNASVASTSAGGVAMGLGATVQANAAQGVALGAGSQVTQAGGVALGAGSVASTAAGVAGYVPPTATAEQRAAIGATTSTQAAVSVGDAANGQYRQITGVAAGTGDSDAVNVNQLKAVQGQVMQMDQGAVKYDTNADGSVDHSNVTLGGSNATGPVTVHNVAPGVQGNDAVNVNQLNAVNNNLNSRIDSVNNRIDGVARNAYAGVASAMALQMPGTYVPGKTVMRLGVGAFKGESAVGLSFRRTSENNAWSVTGGVATSRAGVGATVGAEWVFN
ncbi:ESPR-type extended signal peptide-containing protein [Variovorax ginsengisoli]|uniref:Autotransporter adhesin n=1 Tax=Variovorax ginsengisoli TaxID=363844 RepID=A0ABT9S577_9BURK|nr:ESPR-type extended signal peptide-containing protein [Variovorax ginsengisoli]MDP9899514.1 autotransporter adhesin [Variovorax ginsengisoli]